MSTIFFKYLMILLSVHPNSRAMITVHKLSLMGKIKLQKPLTIHSAYVIIPTVFSR